MSSRAGTQIPKAFRVTRIRAKLLTRVPPATRADSSLLSPLPPRLRRLLLGHWTLATLTFLTPAAAKLTASAPAAFHSFLTPVTQATAQGLALTTRHRSPQGPAWPAAALTPNGASRVRLPNGRQRCLGARQDSTTANRMQTRVSSACTTQVHSRWAHSEGTRQGVAATARSGRSQACLSFPSLAPLRCFSDGHGNFTRAREHVF